MNRRYRPATVRFRSMSSGVPNSERVTFPKLLRLLGMSCRFAAQRKPYSQVDVATEESRLPRLCNLAEIEYSVSVSPTGGMKVTRASSSKPIFNLINT